MTGSRNSVPITPYPARDQTGLSYLRSAGVPRADDAIPKDAISLTDAYNCVVNLVCDHHELLPKFDEDWSEALRKSKEEERGMMGRHRRAVG
jgi:hypothetical protein